MRTRGVIRIGEKRVSYWLTASSVPSDKGLDGGLIIRLTMKMDGRWAYRFVDGRVEMQDGCLEIKRALEILVKAYNGSS